MKTLVRELPASEIPSPPARTGDVLPDGSVLLWSEDMNRMGLDGLRSWLRAVVEEHPSIALASRYRLTSWFRPHHAPHPPE
jgi:hypothetical protein